jgi:hypothetical protein
MRYVLYDDFRELKPVHLAGNRYLFPIKNWLLENGYHIHARRQRGEWRSRSYPGDSTHFHGKEEQKGG